jgi:N-acetyl-alpha-D-muramate 1-phosphate uridylyltransferase
MSAVPRTAMLMTAGKGTRMMPLTADRPKPLISIAGTTLLDHVLDQLRAAGVKRIIANVHYLADQIENHLAAFAQDFDVVISDERDLLRDTGGGLIKALPQIDADPFLCVNADNWWTNGAVNALEALAAAWDASKMDVLMLVVPIERAGNTQGIGDFDLSPDGRLSRDGPKRARPYVWTGIQMMAKHVVIDPPAAVFSTNIFWDRAIEKGRCYGVVHDSDWYDVGYPEAIVMTESGIGHG